MQSNAPDNVFFISDTILIGEDTFYCYDTAQIGGGLIKINDVCVGSHGTSAEFTIENDKYCILYTGISYGLDTGCFTVCNNSQICDTLYFYIYVLPSFNLPAAQPDTDTVLVGNVLVLNAQANDSTYGPVLNFELVNPPAYGDVTLHFDGTIAYNAGRSMCDINDAFTYAICNPVGCDTTTVLIWITCSDIAIFTAVSPNNDGINDVFYIEGIENYPENVLTIFNRWEQPVFQQVAYKNTWSGTWHNGNNLPDGTYYYVLELNAPTDNRVLRGYLEVWR